MAVNEETLFFYEDETKKLVKKGNYSLNNAPNPVFLQNNNDNQFDSLKKLNVDIPIVSDRKTTMHSQPNEMIRSRTFNDQSHCPLDKNKRSKTSIDSKSSRNSPTRCKTHKGNTSGLSYMCLYLLNSFYQIIFKHKKWASDMYKNGHMLHLQEILMDSVSRVFVPRLIYIDQELFAKLLEYNKNNFFNKKDFITSMNKAGKLHFKLLKKKLNSNLTFPKQKQLENNMCLSFLCLFNVLTQNVYPSKLLDTYQR